MNDLLLNILLFVGGFALLTGGAEFLVRGASRLAARLHIPLIVIGLTVVAFGTSLPELMVSLLANLRGGSAAELAIGNVVGSNIANLALILGVVAALRPLSVERQILFREYPLMLAISLIFFAMAWDGWINRVEGIVLFVGLLAFILYSYRSSRDEPEEAQGEAAEYVEGMDGDAGLLSRGALKELAFVAVGIVILMVGANWLVNSAQFIARVLGVSELIIGLSLVALGTSLPELATSAVAMIRNEGDIALGNLVGSNLFNILAIIGITATVSPLPAPQHMRFFDFPVMLAVSVLPLLLVIARPHILQRWQGWLLLVIYFGYNIWLFTNGHVAGA